MKLEELLEQIRQLAQDKKWGLKPDQVNAAEKFALIHTEVSEAFEAYRRNNVSDKDGVNEELADIVIRTLHLAIIFNCDIEAEIVKKIELNKSREWEHPNEHVAA